MIRGLLVRAVSLLIGLLIGVVAHAQDATISEEAQREFGVGVSLLEDPHGPRYAEAYEAFHRAYAASPSPKILSNIGLCAMMLERDGEALDAYERYLRDVPDIDPREREKIEHDLTTLRSGAAELSLSIDPAGAEVVDTRTPPSGAPVTNRYKVAGASLSVRIRAGKHRVVVEAPDRQPEAWSFDVEPGKRHERKVALRRKSGGGPVAPGPTPTPSPTPTPPPEIPIAEPSNGMFIGAMVAVSATGLLVVGAAVTGGLALKYKSDYDGFENGGDRQKAEDVRSKGQTLNIVTDVLIGCAVAGAAVSTVLIVLSLQDDRPETAIEPLMAPGLGGAVVRGRF